MTEHRLQLLQTVKDLHEAGTVKLSDTDRARIEAETADLIQRSLQNSKTAMKAPEGFDRVLEELKGAADADEAFKIVVKFLESVEDIEVETEEKREEGDEEEGEEMDAKGDDKELPVPSEPDAKGEKPGPPKPDEKGEKPGPPKPDEKGGKPPFEKKPGPGMPDKKKPGPGMPDKKKPGPGMPPGLPEEDDKMKAARQELVRRAQEQESESGGGISDLQEQQRDEGAEAPSAAEMGVEDNDLTVSARAAKITVGITRERNLVAYHEDHGPVFYATPSPEVKKDAGALRRLANKVYGIAVYKGFKTAASMCNATLLKDAGVDDDVITDSVAEVPPATKGITSDEETDTRDKPEEPENSALPGNEVDTREKPPTVSDIKTKVITSRKERVLAAQKKRRESKDILDEAENVTKTMKPSKPSGDTGNDAEFNSVETPPGRPGDVLQDADNDIRTAQANMSKLYAARLEKKLAAEKEQFVRKFTRAIRIAATRMLLNHEEHPMKSAAVDVLVNEKKDIEFTSGERFAGMDLSTALELTELIAAEGHDRFMQQLLSRAADLLEKDDRYLADAEDDLQDQAPVPVGDGGPVTASKRPSRNRRSARVRREAAEGNFGTKKNESPAPGSGKVSGGVREALNGGTLLGRRIGRLQG